MKRIYIMSLLILASSIAFGQGQKYAFIEAGGSSTIAAINFDMRFKKNAREGFGFRAGLGNSFSLFDTEQIKDIVIIPLGINYIYGKNKNAILFGLNTSIALMRNKSDNESPFIIAPEIGYRYRPLKKGIGFHASYTPLFNTVDGTMPLWGGLGIGYIW